MTQTRSAVKLPAGELDYVDRGSGPPVVFVAGVWANADLWADVVDCLDDRYRCVALDMPLGAHRRGLPAGTDRSPVALARLILDTLVALDLEDVTLVGNDTAGGLILIALNEPHPGLARVSRLVLTNCDSFEHFPPKSFRPVCTLARRAPWLIRPVLRAALRSRFGRRQFAGSVAAQPLGEERAASFFEPMNIPAAVDDLIGAMANLEPTASIAAAGAIQRFDRPVLLAWGDACRFFPVRHGQRLAESFPDAHLRIIPGAKTWVPVDAPDLLAAMLADFVPRGDAVS